MPLFSSKAAIIDASKDTQKNVELFDKLPQFITQLYNLGNLNEPLLGINQEVQREGQSPETADDFKHFPSWEMYRRVFVHFIKLASPPSAELTPLFIDGKVMLKDNIQDPTVLNTIITQINEDGVFIEAMTTYAAWILREELSTAIDTLVADGFIDGGIPSSLNAYLLALAKNGKKDASDNKRGFVYPEQKIKNPETDTLEFKFSSNQKKDLYSRYFKLLRPDGDIINKTQLLGFINNRIEEFKRIIQVSSNTNKVFNRQDIFKGIENRPGQIRRLIKKLLLDINQVTQTQLKTITNSLIKALIGESEVFSTSFKATGDGGSTTGLLNSSNLFLGVLFFEYDFKQLTTGRQPEVRRKQSFDIYLNEIVLQENERIGIHFSLIGLDALNDNSFLIYVNTNAAPPLQLASVGTPRAYLKEINSSRTASFQWFSRKGVFSNGKLLGVYNPVERDLILEPNFNTNFITIKIKSSNILDSKGRKTNIEEAAVMISLFKYKPGNVLISKEDLFKNDRFEITKSNKEFIFNTQLNNPDLTTLITDYLSQQEHGTDNNIVISAFGGFVGQKAAVPEKNQSVITFDGRYSIPPGIAPNNFEETNIDNPIFSAIRYSFGRIDVTGNLKGKVNNILTINLEAYCSPVWSRLDRKFANDFRGIVERPNIDNLNTFTNPNYEIIGVPSIPQDGNLINIRSYNQVLTALRCMGILELLVEAIEKRTRELEKDGTINSDELTQVIDNISNIKATALVGTFDSNLSFQDFIKFKWYTSPSNQSEYGKLD